MGLDPAQEFLFDPDPDIGGAIVPLFGMPGAGKTNALVNIAKENLLSENIVVWKGSREAQWVTLLANDIPVTLWNHASIDELRTVVTSANPGEKPDRLDLTRERIPETVMGGRDVQSVRVEEWGSAEDLVERFDVGRVNVVNVPGVASGFDFKYPYYFYLVTWRDLMDATVSRNYSRILVMLMDEINEVAPSQEELRKPYFNVVAVQMPKIWAQMRKNNVFMYGAGHSTHDCHYMFWKVKSNSVIYMSNATVKKDISPEISQKKVNRFDRGEFVMPGFTWGDFELLRGPEVLPWMPGSDQRKFRVRWDADIPDLLDEMTDDDDEVDEVDVDQARKVERKMFAHKIHNQAGVEQQDIAEALSLDPSTVSRWISQVEQGEVDD